MLTKCTALWWKRSTKRVEQKLSSHRVHGCLIRARGRRLSENGFPLLSRSSDIWIHNVHGLNGRLDPFSSLRDFELLQEPPCSANEDLNKWSNKADDVLEDVKDIKKKTSLGQVTAVGHAAPIGHGRSRKGDVASAFSVEVGLGKTFKFHLVLSNGLSSRHGFYPKTVYRSVTCISCIEAISARSPPLHPPLEISKLWSRRLFPSSSKFDNFEIPYKCAWMRGRYPPCNETIKWQSKGVWPTDDAAYLGPNGELPSW